MASSCWGVSARGFSDYVNNKMLVLIDGRSVYTPEFGGVYWDTQDFPLEDIAQPRYRLASTAAADLFIAHPFRW